MAHRVPEDQEVKAQRAKERARLAAHRGRATWGERLVPLGEFRTAAAAAGRRLTAAERQAERQAFLDPAPDLTAVEGSYGRIAVFGGIYNNDHALAALLDELASQHLDAAYCLGDLGGFGPHPDKVRPLLEAGGVHSIQGNYEQSLSTGHEDCNCGYTDPRDNHYAEISYRYTADNTSDEFKEWMGSLPRRRRVRLGDRELLLVHGSPRRINEFLFASTSPTPFIEVLLDRERADAVLCTHTGLHWHRQLPSGRDFINVGVIGRPANNGSTGVWYALLEDRGSHLGVELRPLEYDFEGLADEMKRENLPDPFIETIRTGWWTTCLEILPARERQASRYSTDPRRSSGHVQTPNRHPRFRANRPRGGAGGG